MRRAKLSTSARFFKYSLPAKLVYNVTGLAHLQSAEPQALGRSKRNSL
jgi:hypothetical protein